MLALLSFLLLFLTTALAQDVSEESPYWHDRYHAFLSMAAYDYSYLETCPLFFTEEAKQKNFPGNIEPPFTVIIQFGPTLKQGVSGYAVVVPEMNKTVVVFSGVYGWENFDANPASLAPLNVDCDECTAHAAALEAWLEIKELTADMAAVQTVESYNGHIWSLTGHGFGAMVAQVAAIDLGYRNLAHAIHTFGSPRVFNPAGAALFNKLFSGTSNTRTVANNDAIPQVIPESEDYVHVLGGFHVFGSGNATYGQNYEYCSYSASDPNCLGGNSRADHWFYYTTPGTCGNQYNATTYNPAWNEAYEQAQAASYATVSTTPISLNMTATPGPLPTSTVSETNPTAAPEKGGAGQDSSAGTLKVEGVMRWGGLAAMGVVGLALL
ncbi:alpha/beta-hydrolase [Atractiella rhizophila]|nr:alpha/beta-hydrolase [Atractiella rhizophila]